VDPADRHDDGRGRNQHAHQISNTASQNRTERRAQEERILYNEEEIKEAEEKR